MPSFYYPQLDDNTLKALQVIGPLIAANPDYFADSPYSPDKDALLKAMFRPSMAGKALAASVVSPPDHDEVELDDQGQPVMTAVFDGLRQEIVAAFVHLKSAKNLKNQDRVAWAKTAVPLLEKIAKLDALSANIQNVGAFQKAVIELMEEVCTPEQRKKIMERLKDLLVPDASQVGKALETDDDIEG